MGYNYRVRGNIQEQSKEIVKMARTDYLDNVEAPTANSIIPAASAIISDGKGRLLLQKRKDNQLWALPGGTMEIGESIGECIKREVKEETGLEIEPMYVVGIYSNPKHVIAFSDGEVRQEFSICFACRMLGGTLAASNESDDVQFFLRREIAGLEMHPSIKERITDYWKRKKAQFY